MANQGQQTRESEYVQDLSEEKLAQAEDARRAAMEIVQDALDKGFYGFPISFYYTCSDPIDPHNFCCILTEQFLRDLLRKMEEVVFKEDTLEDAFAYVYRTDGTDNTVYLCKDFWEAPDNLCLNSKPGTLIHEVSHLLGTDDITYDHLRVVVYEDYNTLLGWSGPMSGQGVEGHAKEEAVQINANSVEHEFETVINHEQCYNDGRYKCCGETKKHSVCKRRETGHYHLHKRFPRQKEEMETRLQQSSPEMMVRYLKVAGRACKKTRI